MRTCRHCEKKFDQEEPTPTCGVLGEGKVCEGKPRGFAALSRERVAEIAARGGVSAHQNGRAHQFSSAEAKAAGILGGNAPHRRRGPQRKGASA